MGADECLAVGHEAGGQVRNEQQMVPEPASCLSRRLFTAQSRIKTQSLIEERLTWSVRAVLKGGGDASHLLPDKTGIVSLHELNQKLVGK